LRGGGPNDNTAKVGHKRSGSRDLILNFGTPRISRTASATALKYSVPIDGWEP